MMLDHDPARRPSIRLLCQGFEDSFLFPKEIQVPGVGDATIPDKSDSFALQIAQGWVRMERDRIKNMNVSDIDNSNSYYF